MGSLFYSWLQKDVSEEPLWKELVKTRMHLRDINVRHWLENCLFTPVWWLMVFLCIGLWVAWWKLVDRTRFMEIITFGLMITIVSILYDIIATDFVLWGYPNKIVPLTPPMLFVDFCLMPVIYSLVYQYYTSWQKYLIATLITAGVFSFVLEPLSVWLDIFQLNNWNYLYSFLVDIIRALSLKWVMTRIKAIQENS